MDLCNERFKQTRNLPAFQLSGSTDNPSKSPVFTTSRSSINGSLLPWTNDSVILAITLPSLEKHKIISFSSEIPSFC